MLLILNERVNEAGGQKAAAAARPPRAAREKRVGPAMRPCPASQPLPSTTSCGVALEAVADFRGNVQCNLRKRAVPFQAPSIRLSLATTVDMSVSYRLDTSEVARGGQPHHWWLTPAVHVATENLVTDPCTCEIRVPVPMRGGSDVLTLTGQREKVKQFVMQVQAAKQHSVAPEQEEDEPAAKRPKPNPHAKGVKSRTPQSHAGGKNTASAKQPTMGMPPPPAKEPRGSGPSRKLTAAALKEVMQMPSGAGGAQTASMSVSLMQVKPGLGSGNAPSARYRKQHARRSNEQPLPADGGGLGGAQGSIGHGGDGDADGGAGNGVEGRGGGQGVGSSAVGNAGDGVDRRGSGGRGGGRGHGGHGDRSDFAGVRANAALAEGGACADPSSSLCEAEHCDGPPPREVAVGSCCENDDPAPIAAAGALPSPGQSPRHSSPPSPSDGPSDEARSDGACHADSDALSDTVPSEDQEPAAQAIETDSQAGVDASATHATLAQLRPDRSSKDLTQLTVMDMLTDQSNQRSPTVRATPSDRSRHECPPGGLKRRRIYPEEGRPAHFPNRRQPIRRSGVHMHTVHEPDDDPDMWMQSPSRPAGRTYLSHATPSADNRHRGCGRSLDHVESSGYHSDEGAEGGALQSRFNAAVDSEKSHGSCQQTPHATSRHASARVSRFFDAPSRNPQRRPHSPTPPDGCMRGLKNLGNTCYVNATLQCLASSHSLSSSLHELCEARRAIDLGQTPLKPCSTPLPEPSLATAALPLLAPSESARADRSESRTRHFKETLVEHFPIFQGVC